jgi:hypothetical protein
VNDGSGDGDAMLALILILIIAWMIVGIVGFVVHGLFWLFVIACVLFVATVLGGVFRRGRRSVGGPR